jgi:hypothetical protein
MNQGLPCFQLWSRLTLLPASSKGVSHGRETSSSAGKVGDGRGDSEVKAAMTRHQGRLHRGRRRQRSVNVEGGDGAASREAAMMRHRRWGRRRHGVEGGDTKGGGDSTASVLREATTVPREAVGNQAAERHKIKFSPRVRVSRRRVTALYNRGLFVSGGIAQAIAKMWLLVSADLSQPIPIILCISWLTSAATNKEQSR